MQVRAGALRDSWLPRLQLEDLTLPFREGETPREQHRIGLEAEKFGVVAATGQPLHYAGPSPNVVEVLSALRDNGTGWQPYEEVAQGPLLGLQREGAAVTLEPGGQLEWSGSPFPDVHQCMSELSDHFDELRPVSEAYGLRWLSMGFHPTAQQRDFDWVPKRRYPIMREYLPTRGSGALDMMRRTATIQVNLDYCDERDAMRKLRLLLALTPVLSALFCSAPFFEGARAPQLSVRQDVWHRMDATRSGLIEQLWRKPNPGYEDYVQWALRAGMFLFLRWGNVIANTGQSFESFLRSGYREHHATMADWRLHLTTLFPEVRLKRTLEVRCCDAVPAPLACALPSLLVGLVYDERALSLAEELASRWSLAQVQTARRELLVSGLVARLGERSLGDWAERFVDLARAGLGRRARLDELGRDESWHLRPLETLLSRRQTVAEQLLERLGDAPPWPALLDGMDAAVGWQRG